MLGIHELATPDDYPAGKIAFREKDIMSYSSKLKVVKHERLLQRKLRKSLSTEGLRDPVFDSNKSDITPVDVQNVMI